MSRPRPSLGKVFVVLDSGVWQASLLSEAVRCGCGDAVRASVRVRGEARPRPIDDRLVFSNRAQASALRSQATALTRTAAWRHRSVREAAIHLIETGGRAP